MRLLHISMHENHGQCWLLSNSVVTNAVRLATLIASGAVSDTVISCETVLPRTEE